MSLELEDSRSKLENSNEARLTGSGPISSIPKSILRLIFQHYVEIGGSVWELIPVSKHWEQISFDTCSLWTSILVQNCTSRNQSIVELIHNGETEYYMKNTDASGLHSKSNHICFEQSHLCKAISRAGECLLQIEIGFHPVSSQERFSLDFALDMLMKPTISTRIKSLKLSIYGILSAPIRSDHFRHVTLPNLSRLDIVGPPPEWLQNLLRSVSATTGNLEVFKCQSDGPMEQYLSDRILNRIRFLSLGGCGAPRQLDTIMLKLGNVEDIVGLPLGWPTDNTPQGTVLHLREALLFCNPLHIRRIQWPNLELLKVHDLNDIGAVIVPQMVEPGDSTQNLTTFLFPMLTGLEIWSPRPLDWLSNVSAPQLNWLRIYWTEQLNPQFPIHLPFTPFSSLSSLSFHASCDDEVTVSLLKLVPNVTFVELSSSPMNPRFGLRLLRSLLEIEGDILCPKLGHLKFAPYQVPTPKGTLEPEIKLLVQREERIAFHLRVSVLWSTSDGILEYGSASSSSHT